jgi:hypothetical protein
MGAKNWDQATEIENGLGNYADQVKPTAPMNQSSQSAKPAKAAEQEEITRHDVSKLEKAILPGYCTPFEIKFKNGVRVFVRAIPQGSIKKGLACKITLPSEFKNTDAFENAMRPKKFGAYLENDGTVTLEIVDRTQPRHHKSSDINGLLDTAIKDVETKGNKTLTDNLKNLKKSHKTGLTENLQSTQKTYDSYIELRYGGYGVPVKD